MSSGNQSENDSYGLTPLEAEEAKKALGGAKTIAELYRRNHEERVKPLLLSIPNGEKVHDAVIRLYYPWPDWVLRVAVEVWSVHFPTIKKEVIYDSFRFVHFIVFEMPLDGSDSAELPRFPKIDPKVLGSMIGHVSVLPESLRATADEALKVGVISPEKHAEVLNECSSESFQKKMQPYMTNYFKAQPDKWLDVCENIADAKRKTLDENRQLKETTLTKVYAAILRDWDHIEQLAGPTELCEFLGPVLDGSENDPVKKLDRVKKICRRMDIQFKPAVKGQAHPPGLSLPPAV